MRNALIIEDVKSNISAKLGSRFRGLTVKLIFSFLFPFTGIAQENPWETEQTGTNPWEQQPTTEKKAPKQTEQEVIEVVESTVSVESPEAQIFIDLKTAPTTSPSAQILYLDGDTMNFIGKEDEAYLLEYLEGYAYEKQNGKGYFAAGMLGGLVFNVFATPVLPLAGLPESADGRSTVNKFQKSNPLASHEAVKAIKKGSRKKRVKKVFLGTLTGALAQVAVFFAAILIIF